MAAGLAAARRRGRKGGRPPTVDPERLEQILAALEGDASKAAVCRSFQVPRSTLLDTLEQAGWTGAGIGAEAGTGRSVSAGAGTRRAKNAGPKARG